jgi:uncharacterized damage-inducible protein DinB
MAAMTSNRTDVPTRMDERTTLLTMLDYTRKTAIEKCAGISDEDARKAPLPTSPLMTVSGVLSHIRWVEFSWIQPIKEIVADYQAMARGHDALIAGWDLDMPAAHRMRSGEAMNLRWILHHLVEENARHNGHLDILRELAYRVTGD